MSEEETAGYVVAGIGALALAAAGAYVILEKSGYIGPKQTYNYTVSVFDENGTSIVGAACTLIGLQGKITGPGGTAVFYAVPEGNYTLEVSSFGYGTADKQVSVNATHTVTTVTLYPTGVCQPPTGGCPPGYYWSTIDCACVPQTVASITATPPSLSPVQNWYTHATVGLAWTPLCAGTTPDGDPGCNGTCGPDLTLDLVVQVLDAKNNPIEGIDVTGYLSLAEQPWRSSDGNTWGHFAVYFDRDVVTTDVNGEAAFKIIIACVLDGGNNQVAITCNGAAAVQGLSELLTFRVPNSPVSGQATLGMTSTVYCYDYP